MPLLMLLASLTAFGGDDVVEMKAGDPAPDVGVWMTEAKFRYYVAAGRKLPACQETLDKALDEVVTANQRVLSANDIAQAQFKRDETLAADQLQVIADLGAKLDQERQRNSRLQQQRNVAWGIAGGFLTAATAAIVLALN
jgi:hypothetical protein